MLIEIALLAVTAVLVVYACYARTCYQKLEQRLILEENTLLDAEIDLDRALVDLALAKAKKVVWDDQLDAERVLRMNAEEAIENAIVELAWEKDWSKREIRKGCTIIGSLLDGHSGGTRLSIPERIAKARDYLKQHGE